MELVILLLGLCYIAYRCFVPKVSDAAIDRYMRQRHYNLERQSEVERLTWSNDTRMTFQKLLGRPMESWSREDVRAAVAEIGLREGWVYITLEELLNDVEYLCVTKAPKELIKEARGKTLPLRQKQLMALTFYDHDMKQALHDVWYSKEVK